MQTFSETQSVKEAVRKRDGYRCVDCGVTEGERENTRRRRPKLHVHRIVPDGQYSLGNCKTLCPSCHCKRRRDFTGEWPKPTWTKRASIKPVGIKEIQELLDLKGWSQTQLAANLDLGEAAINRWFVGDRNPGGPAAILMRMWLAEAREEAQKQPA